MHQGIANGWSAWVELWEAKTYAMSRLRECGNRLRKPELSLAFNWLVRDWERTKRKAEQAGSRRPSRSRQRDNSRSRQIRDKMGPGSHFKAAPLSLIHI